MSRRSGVATTRLVGVLLVALTVGAGCSSMEPTDAGACLAEPTRDLQTADVVDCEEGHAQVVAWEDLPFGELEGWPGPRALATVTYDLCAAAYEARAGEPLGAPFEIWFDHPDEASWEAGDRRATCAVTRADGAALGGSLLGG